MRSTCRWTFFISLFASSVFFFCASDSSCDSWRAELLRRQTDERKESSTSPYDADSLGNTKHKPFLRVEGQTAVALVGLGAVTGLDADPVHPMVNSSDPSILHWIDTIWIEDQLGDIICMRRLSPEEPAPAILACPIPRDTHQITAFQHCNSHGTFVGQTLTLDSLQADLNIEKGCTLTTCNNWTSSSHFCSASIAEYWRLYSREFSSSVAKDGNLNLKHKPSLTVHGNGTATVTVGAENQVDGSTVFHPMKPSSDPSVVHWINSIWVVDQAGKVIASRIFLPTEASLASLTFEIPSGTTEITPYEYCNKHGLYIGDKSAVGITSSSFEAVCNSRACVRPQITFAKEIDCSALIAESKRRQINENARSPLAFSVPWGSGTKNEKHNPYIVLNGTVAKVVVGKGASTGVDTDPVHPMVDDPENIHYIESIWVEDQSGRLVAYRQLSPSEPSPATLYFDVPEGTTSLRAYEYCNTHGLFEGTTVSVSPTNTRIGARFGCSVQTCMEGTSVSSCQAFTSELDRRETSGSAKDDPSGKHKPYLTLDGTTATIVVGIGATPGHQGGLIHPMTESVDPAEVHWISHVFARDDMGNLVAMCELLPSDPAPASCTFEVPQGIVFLRPYEFCNKHGLYVGEIVQVSSGNPSASRSCLKRECFEAQPSISNVSFDSSAVLALYSSQKASTERISTSNMCLQHSAIFSIIRSRVNISLQSRLQELTRDGSASSDALRRLDAFGVFRELLTLGGTWQALPVVFEHVFGDDNSSLRLELLDTTGLKCTQQVLPPGQEVFAEGVDIPVSDPTQELMILECTFAMNWGYRQTKTLGPHYTIFYSPNFTAGTVHVALCAKTHGWMGIGWLTQDHVGHFMNYTDMAIAFVRDGQAVVQDRFAYGIEEPLKDDLLTGQRQDDFGDWNVNGGNDLELQDGALGVSGKEWCPDAGCKPGFSLVQFSRTFSGKDSYDARLPAKTSKIGLIYAFATKDPTDVEMVQHIMSSTGYVDLEWNLDCPPGTYFEIYTIECKPCDKGWFRPGTSPVYKCLQAPLGTYQNETGQASPKPCKRGFTTMFVGATDEFACVCPGPTLDIPHGRYHVEACGPGEETEDVEGFPTRCAALGSCVDCPEGMICKGARDLKRSTPAVLQRVSDFCTSFAFSQSAPCTSITYCSVNPDDSDCGHKAPELLPGYWSSMESPLSVFRCLSIQQCLGGPPGSPCAKGREGISCGFCVPGYYKASRGECIVCSGSDYIPGLVGLFIGFTAVAGLFVYSQADASKGTVTTLTATIAVSQMGVLVQTLGIFADLSLEWVDPIKTVLSAMRLFNFDLDIIKVQCYMPTDSPTLSLLAQLLVFPGLAFLLALGTFLKDRLRRRSFGMTRYMNAVGLCAFVLYPTLCMASMRSLHCIVQPNGLQTVATNPAVICWNGGTHSGLVGLSIAGILVYAVGIMAYILQITYRYPELMKAGSGIALLEKYRFLFKRFGACAYYWGSYFLLQKVAVALVPILFPNSAVVQILVLSALIVSYMIAITRVFPWASHIANGADIFANLGLLMFLQMSSFFVGVRGQTDLHILGVLLVVLISLLLSFLCGVISLMIKRKFMPAQTYSIFLCHHKLGAAVLCRWLKTALLEERSGRVFLDSDELEELADIGEIVKTSVQTLVIVGSRLVLSRPWCAVEVCAAVIHKVNIVLVECPDFELYDETQLEQLKDSWTDSDKMIFARSGIDPDRINECYRDLQYVPRVYFDQFASTGEQHEAVNNIISLTSKARKKSSLETFRQSIRIPAFNSSERADAAQIVVLGASGSPEARMTCKFIATMVRDRTHVIVATAFNSDEVTEHLLVAQYMVIVLTSGLFRDEQFLDMLITIEEYRSKCPLEIVAALADNTFEFPGSIDYDILYAKSPTLGDAIKRVVNILALPVSAHGSMNVIDTQVSELCRRFVRRKLSQQLPSSNLAL